MIVSEICNFICEVVPDCFSAPEHILPEAMMTMFPGGCSSYLFPLFFSLHMSVQPHPASAVRQGSHSRGARNARFMAPVPVFRSICRCCFLRYSRFVDHDGYRLEGGVAYQKTEIDNSCNDGCSRSSLTPAQIFRFPGRCLSMRNRVIALLTI